MVTAPAIAHPPPEEDPQPTYFFDDARVFVHQFLADRDFSRDDIDEVLIWLIDYIENHANAGLIVDPVADFPDDLRTRISMEIVVAVDEAHLEYMRHLGLVVNDN